VPSHASLQVHAGASLVGRLPGRAELDLLGAQRCHGRRNGSPVGFALHMFASLLTTSILRSPGGRRLNESIDHAPHIGVPILPLPIGALGGAREREAA
jgi:hypothetical protein